MPPDKPPSNPSVSRPALRPSRRRSPPTDYPPKRPRSPRARPTVSPTVSPQSTLHLSRPPPSHLPRAPPAPSTHLASHLRPTRRQVKPPTSTPSDQAPPSASHYPAHVDPRPRRPAAYPSRLPTMHPPASRSPSAHPAVPRNSSPPARPPVAHSSGLHQPISATYAAPSTHPPSSHPHVVHSAAPHIHPVAARQPAARPASARSPTTRQAAARQAIGRVGATRQTATLGPPVSIPAATSRAHVGPSIRQESANVAPVSRNPVTRMAAAAQMSASRHFSGLPSTSTQLPTIRLPSEGMPSPSRHPSTPLTIHGALANGTAHASSARPPMPRRPTAHSVSNHLATSQPSSTLQSGAFPMSATQPTQPTQPTQLTQAQLQFYFEQQHANGERAGAAVWASDGYISYGGLNVQPTSSPSSQPQALSSAPSAVPSTPLLPPPPQQSSDVHATTDLVTPSTPVAQRGILARPTPSRAILQDAVTSAGPSVSPHSANADPDLLQPSPPGGHRRRQPSNRQTTHSPHAASQQPANGAQVGARSSNPNSANSTPTRARSAPSKRPRATTRPTTVHRGQAQASSTTGHRASNAHQQHTAPSKSAVHVNHSSNMKNSVVPDTTAMGTALPNAHHTSRFNPNTNQGNAKKKNDCYTLSDAVDAQMANLNALSQSLGVHPNQNFQPGSGNDGTNSNIAPVSLTLNHVNANFEVHESSGHNTTGEDPSRDIDDSSPITPSEDAPARDGAALGRHVASMDTEGNLASSFPVVSTTGASPTMPTGPRGSNISPVLVSASTSQRKRQGKTSSARVPEIPRRSRAKTSASQAMIAQQTQMRIPQHQLRDSEDLNLPSASNADYTTLTPSINVSRGIQPPRVMLETSALPSAHHQGNADVYGTSRAFNHEEMLTAPGPSSFKASSAAPHGAMHIPTNVDFPVDNVNVLPMNMEQVNPKSPSRRKHTKKLPHPSRRARVAVFRGVSPSRVAAALEAELPFATRVEQTDVMDKSGAAVGGSVEQTANVREVQPNSTSLPKSTSEHPTGHMRDSAPGAPPPPDVHTSRNLQLPMFSAPNQSVNRPAGFDAPTSGFATGSTQDAILSHLVANIHRTSGQGPSSPSDHSSLLNASFNIDSSLVPPLTPFPFPTPPISPVPLPSQITSPFALSNLATGNHLDNISVPVSTIWGKASNVSQHSAPNSIPPSKPPNAVSSIPPNSNPYNAKKRHPTAKRPPLPPNSASLANPSAVFHSQPGTSPHSNAQSGLNFSLPLGSVHEEPGLGGRVHLSPQDNVSSPLLTSHTDNGALNGLDMSNATQNVNGDLAPIANGSFSAQRDEVELQPNGNYNGTTEIDVSPEKKPPIQSDAVTKSPGMVGPWDRKKRNIANALPVPSNRKKRRRENGVRENVLVINPPAEKRGPKGSRSITPDLRLEKGSVPVSGRTTRSTRKPRDEHITDPSHVRKPRYKEVQRVETRTSVENNASAAEARISEQREARVFENRTTEKYTAALDARTFLEKENAEARIPEHAQGDEIDSLPEIVPQVGEASPARKRRGRKPAASKSQLKSLSVILKLRIRQPSKVVANKKDIRRALTKPSINGPDDSPKNVSKDTEGSRARNAKSTSKKEIVSWKHRDDVVPPSHTLGSDAPVKAEQQVHPKTKRSHKKLTEEEASIFDRDMFSASAISIGYNDLSFERNCGFCGKPETKDCPLSEHPFFALHSLVICKSCDARVSSRHCPQQKMDATLKRGPKGIKNGTIYFVAVVEDMILVTKAAERHARRAEEAYNVLKERTKQEILSQAKALPVPFEMVTVMRTLLSKLSVNVRGGKLQWPNGPVEVLSSDGADLIRVAWPMTTEDMVHGESRGERAWRSVFGKDGELGDDTPSCVVLQKALGLLGIRISFPNKVCSHNRDKYSKCLLQLDSISVDAAMLRAASFCKPTPMRAIFAQHWNRKDALRAIEAEDIDKMCRSSLRKVTDACCICGRKHDEEKYPLRFTTCNDCSKQICSICLSSVIGSTEYVRACRGKFRCLLCRFKGNRRVFPGKKKVKSENVMNGENSSSGEGDDDDEDGESRKYALRQVEEKVDSVAPMVLLSQRAVHELLMEHDSETLSEAVGFGKVCELVNDKALNGGRVGKRERFEHVCLSCKGMAVDTRVSEVQKRTVSNAAPIAERAPNEAVLCSFESCGNAMHRGCLSKGEQTRRRGARSKWLCPHHKCVGCDQRDDTKLIRCRTCPKAFCKEHVPLPSELYVYSEKLIACRDCQPRLDVPRVASGRVSKGTESHRKGGSRNTMAMAVANMQGQKRAALEARVHFK